MTAKRATSTKRCPARKRPNNKDLLFRNKLSLLKCTNLIKTVTRFGSLPPMGTPKTTALEEGASKVAVTQSNVEFTKFITKMDAILLEISIQFATRLQTSLVFKHMHCNKNQKHQGPAYKFILLITH